MKITLTGYPEGLKIHAIKAVRAITGLGLKETKEIVDSMDRGATPEVTILPSLTLREAMHDLDREGILYRTSSWTRMLNFCRGRRPRLPQAARAAIPIYVTRHTANGATGSWTINAFVGLVILLLLQLNAVVWPLVGLYEAFRVVFG